MSDSSPTPKAPNIVAPGAVQIPMLYANGFQNNGGPNDITTILAHSERPIASLTMALPAAKAYALGLLDLIDRIEKVTGIEIKSVNEMNDAIDAAQVQGKGGTNE